MKTRSTQKTGKNASIPFGAYLEYYYQDVASEDIASRTPEDRQSAAKAHLNIAQTRVKGTPIMHVYNPEAARDGWQSKSTVIDIVTDDMPFLVDSVRMELNRQGYNVNIIIHPLCNVERNKSGKLVSIAPYGELEDGQHRESFIHAEIDRETDAEALSALERGLGQTLMDVRRSVEDWPKMRDSLSALIEDMDNENIPFAAADVAETKAFLQWLDSNNFTFLGSRDYKLVSKNNKQSLAVVKGSGLGILREDADDTASRKFSVFSREISSQQIEQELLVVTKANTRSTVHRPAHLDYFSVKRYDKTGKFVGERRFVGLYTSSAYRKNPRNIPYVRGKIKKVFAASKLDPVSHLGKAFNHVLETYPRDELFQISEQDLRTFAEGIMQLGESQRIKVFVRDDRFKRFVSCLVYIPRDLFDTKLRRQVSDILYKAFNGVDIEFNVSVSDDALARVEFIVRTDPKNFPRYNVVDIEEEIIEVARHWSDHLKAALQSSLEIEESSRQLKQYQNAFPVSYQEDFSGEQAVEDIRLMNTLSERVALAMNVYAEAKKSEAFHFKLYHTGGAIAPSDCFHILENMGVKIREEKPYVVKTEKTVWMHDYFLNHADNEKVNISAIKPLFEEAFLQAWQGNIENDGFNRLVLNAQLSWREVAMLRAYCKYLLQTKQSFSQAYMEETLSAHPSVVRMLVDLFVTRFDPAFDKDRNKTIRSIEKKIEKALDAVSSLDQDRILRNFLAVILATSRTNYYQTVINGESGDAEYHEYISFKYNTALVPELPEPRPMFEIFVYSPRVEGVHLRFGKVARGGLRWSDRREDFRTEVLGLVKAQQVKNSVIVPVGAKGGFVVKRPPENADRDTLMKEVVACYTSFISGLLDVTDNIKQGDIVPPQNVVRFDEDDPYLVVAADKGTATFSDIANGIAEQYGFWMGDAFASGGSNGYDHKKMGITARGAWESVKLIFRDLGKDIQSEDFTTVGVGDMAGDVFGNGMLLSRHTRLIAAFNHMHIFLDPNPDAEQSYVERERLFNLPRSSWEDYNSKLISKGGGIYSRSAKSISLSPEIREALDIKETALSPTALITAILKSPVELLWNGGIGTYVKASTEQHSEVGDRANDVLRVNGNELRCKCVGEGGNLGLTQRGRIEFALNGGRVDTDFIHNAGGVDCSDHEVNIKILLNMLIQDKTITEKQRTKLLVDMTDEVSESVLQSNYWQGQALAQIEEHAPQMLDAHWAFMRDLESEGDLNRELEALPSDEEMAERKLQGKGLTRPEIAVLVSYSKIAMFPELTDSDLWDDEYFSKKLMNYFPSQLHKRFSEQMQEHQLRREILATSLVNRLVNRMGATFAYRLKDETGASFADIARAYTIVWEVFGLRNFWSSVANLDNKVSDGAQTRMLLEAVNLAYRSSKWLLQHRRRSLDIEENFSTYRAGAEALFKLLPTIFENSKGKKTQAKIKFYLDSGVPKAMALHVVAMDSYYSTFDIVDVANKLERDVQSVTDMYFKVTDYLDVFWLRNRADDLVIDNQWQARARVAMTDDLYGILRGLTRVVLSGADSEKESATKCMDKWTEESAPAIQRYQQVINEFKVSEHIDIAMFSVALREIQNILQASVVR